MKKRVLSMFMALALCLTLLPAPALADELGPVDGTSTVETAGADAEAEAKAKAGAEAVAAVQAQITTRFWRHTWRFRRHMMPMTR